MLFENHHSFVQSQKKALVQILHTYAPSDPLVVADSTRVDVRQLQQSLLDEVRCATLW
jgi:hypothetical protein